MTIGTLAVRVRRAICSMSDEEAAGVALDRPVGRPDLGRRAEVDAAAPFTAAKNWLAFGDEAANVALLLDRAP